jgi:hypothetical protein
MREFGFGEYYMLLFSMEKKEAGLPGALLI